jgi:hypothetical protein
MNSNTARLAAVVALASGIFCGTGLADTMTGSLKFGFDPITNYYDPVNGFALAGSSNATANSPTVTLLGGTTATFGYQDFVNTDTAAFTAGQLDIENILGPDFGFGQGSASWTQTFTASATGFFTGWTLSSSNFNPATLTWSLNPTSTTLTVTWGGTDTGGPTFHAIFASSPTSPVPGPIVGAGLPGLALACGGILAWRRRKRAMA